MFIDDDRDGVRDVNELFTLADGEGRWTLFGIRPGMHEVRVDPRTGFQVAIPVDGAYPITLPSGGEITDLDFGLTAGRLGEIRGSKWNDVNGNGVWDVVGTNLVANGDFESGNVGFSSPLVDVTLDCTFDRFL